MRLKEFVESPNRIEQDEPHVTLSHCGVIRLNKLAFEMLDTPAAVNCFMTRMK